MNEDEKQQLKARVDSAAAQLSEHFESVLILCTKGTEDGRCNTAGFEVGRGNFYAQYGHAVEWIVMQDQFQRNEAIRRDKQSEDEDL